MATDVGREVSIQRIAADQWQGYRRIRLAALADAPEAFASTYAESVAQPDEFWRGRAARGADGDQVVIFIAVHEPTGKWIGLGGGMRPGDPPADVDVTSVWVHPQHRGRGVAPALVRQILQWAGESGAVSAGLWVTIGNVPAGRLYDGLGFRRTGATQPLPSDPTRVEEQLLLDLGS